MTPRNGLQLALSFPLAIAVFTGSEAGGQTPDRLPRVIDSVQVQTLANHHPMWANPANDAGPVPASFPLENLTLVLKRSAEQEQAFEQFLKDQQDPASPDYRHWLTPDEIGERFGLSDRDIGAITGWLQSQGLRVNWVAPSRVFIAFSGSAAAVSRALQAELHYYHAHGAQRISVASDPMIPTALGPALKSIRGLYTIADQPFHFAGPIATSAPDLTVSGGAAGHVLAPGDFAKIYDLPASFTGAGTTIGIVSESRTDAADFNNFKSLTGSAFANPTETIPTAFGGADPGPAYTTLQNCDSYDSCYQLDLQGEATLDVTRAGSVAPGASLLLVVASTDSGGVAIDAQYIVQSTPVPAQVMSISFGACESEGGPSGVQFWDALFQQAAAEGISVFVSSGDSGASGCDADFTTPPANPLPDSPNYICSSTYATCVGGTEFNDSSNLSSYWSSTNGPGLTSALHYIPEGAWNEPLDSDSNPQIAASGGGVSSYIFTPTWQTGTGVPAARTGRYTPDIAFSASGHDSYFICFAATGGDCVSGTGGFTYTTSWGTSAAAPDMAGIAALVVQKSGGAQGNLNPALYSMAAKTPGAFHQVSISSSGVANCALAVPSMCNNSAPGPTGLSGGQTGYSLGQTGGYSEVTGLGSLDVAQFLDNYTPTVSTEPAPTVTLTAQPSVTTAQSASVLVTVTGSGSIAPSGTVTLSSGSYTSANTTLDIPGPDSNSVYIVIPSGALALGTDTLTVNYTSNSKVYSNATGSTTILVTTTKPTPTVSWAAPAAIVYGTALGATELDATASVPGTFSYSPTASTVLTAGKHTLTTIFAPNDTADYSSASGSVTLTVNRAVPVLSWATPAAVPAGSVLGASQQNASASVSGVFTYTPAAGTLLSAPGNVSLSVAFVPTDSTDYTTATASVVLAVTAVTQAPAVTTGAATTIASSSATLNGQATPNGADAHIWFLYGTSSTLSGASQTPSQDIGAGSTAAQFSAGLSGLAASSTYYFQAVAQNSSGTTLGSIQSFTTPAAPAFTVIGTPLTLSKGANTGNTSAIIVTPSGGFTGSVTLSAVVTTNPSGAQNTPTLNWLPSNGQVSITGTSAATATLIIVTTPATVGANQVPARPESVWRGVTGTMLACILLVCVPARRRNLRNLLGVVALFVVLAGGITACSGGNSGTVQGGGGGNSGTTSGAYTITVTATSGSTSVTSPVSLIVQ